MRLRKQAHTHSALRRPDALALALLAALMIFLALGATAQADLSFCPPGSGPGQCLTPQGIAVNNETGRIYVADLGNNRIGLIDIYDAKAGGGLPPPPLPAPPCEGEACQNPAGAPNDQTPASASFRGEGNPVTRKASKARCAKGNRKVRRAGKSRCVKAKKNSQRTNTKRRAPR